MTSIDWVLSLWALAVSSFLFYHCSSGGQVSALCLDFLYLPVTRAYTRHRSGHVGVDSGNIGADGCGVDGLSLWCVFSINHVLCMSLHIYAVLGAMQSNATDKDHQGLVHGTNQSLSSLFRGLGPAASGLLFSLSLRFKFPLVTFFVTGALYYACVAIISTLNKVDIWRISDQRENQMYQEDDDKGGAIELEDISHQTDIVERGEGSGEDGGGEQKGGQEATMPREPEHLSNGHVSKEVEEVEEPPAQLANGESKG